MKVLVACEESQTVCKAFRVLGHEAYSCDKKPCSGGRPEWHIIADALDVLYGGWFRTQSGVRVYIESWDKVIAHPPCDRLTYAGVRWLDERNLWMDLEYAIDFFNEFREYGERGNSIAIENPIPHKYAVNGFWLNEKKKWQDIHRKMGNTPERKTFRSKTFPGIAQAMAEQWGKLEVIKKVA